MIVVSAPSGAGKTTIVKHLLSRFPQLGFSVSATSRGKRAGEKDGREYHFVSQEKFESMIAHHELLEWQEVYPGSYYGTPISELNRMLGQGLIPVFDVDVVGGTNIKKMFGREVLALFIKPPSLTILENRLRLRGTENEASISKRIQKAEWEMGFEKEFDWVIVNDQLEEAFAQAGKAVSDFLKS